MPKNILLATRPITPPWDEASKNFAYFLVKSIHDPELQMHILTTASADLDINKTVICHPIYPAIDKNHAGFPLSQKVHLPLYLIGNAHTYNIIHYLFTPTKLNSWITRHLVSQKPKTIQTIVTLREDILTPADWQTLFFADRLVVYSDYSKQKLEAAGFTGIQRIYPGIDLDFFRPTEKDPEALRTLNLSPDDFVVMYPGEYARLGATDMLVNMLIQHINEFENSKLKNLKFVFACRLKNDADKKKKTEVQEKLRQAGILDHVRFTDTWQLEQYKLYNLADIIVFPVSDMKGKFDIPLVIIEAYACGKPVILSNLEIFREFSDNTFSVTIPRNDTYALQAAITDLANDPAQRKTLGHTARAFVEKNFDLKATAKAYAELYASL